MPLMTLKEIVVDILNDLDSDPISVAASGEDIDTTEEARQVHQIVKTTYFNMIDGRDWNHLYGLFTLTESDATTPSFMTIPTDSTEIDYVKYNVRNATDTKDKYKLITYKEPLDFMNMIDSRDSSLTEIDVVTAGTLLRGNIYNDRAPSYWTSLDDLNILFDAYDSAVEAFMATIKTQCRGKVYPTWVATDAAVPNLPINAFSWLLAESKSTASIVLKQAANGKAEQWSNTQRRRMSIEAQKVDNTNKWPDYGRRGKKG